MGYLASITTFPTPKTDPKTPIQTSIRFWVTNHLFCGAGILDLTAESAFIICDFICPMRYFGSKIPTIDNNLQAVSLGCAPTPIQYRVRVKSSFISLKGRPVVSPGRGGWGREL